MPAARALPRAVRASRYAHPSLPACRVGDLYEDREPSYAPALNPGGETAGDCDRALGDRDLELGGSRCLERDRERAVAELGGEPQALATGALDNEATGESTRCLPANERPWGSVTTILRICGSGLRAATVNESLGLRLAAPVSDRLETYGRSARQPSGVRPTSKEPERRADRQSKRIKLPVAGPAGSGGSGEVIPASQALLLVVPRALASLGSDLRIRSGTVI